jgi:hypothetical protein
MVFAPEAPVYRHPPSASPGCFCSTILCAVLFVLLAEHAAAAGLYYKLFKLANEEAGNERASERAR